MSFDPLFVIHPLVAAYKAGQAAGWSTTSSFFRPPYPRYAIFRRWMWQEGWLLTKREIFDDLGVKLKLKQKGR